MEDGARLVKSLSYLERLSSVWKEDPSQEGMNGMIGSGIGVYMGVHRMFLGACSRPALFEMPILVSSLQSSSAPVPVRRIFSEVSAVEQLLQFNQKRCLSRMNEVC